MLNRSSVDVIVGFVSADESDVDRLERVEHANDESIGISLDVEHNTIVRQKTGRPVARLHILRCRPVRGAGFAIPHLQRPLGIGVLFPELSEA